MTSRSRSVLALLLGIVIGGGSMLVGLAQAGRLAPERPEMLVALGQLLEAEHRRIDLLEKRGDWAGAIEALEALRDQAWPTLEEGGQAAVQLRHDVYGRLLRLRLDHPEVAPKSPDELLAIAREGLGPELDPIDANPFTARLIALEGEILEALGRDDDALRSYERALDINRVLLDAELGEPVP